MKNYTLLIATLIVLGFASCRKTPVQTPVAELVVQLNEAYLAAAQIDSADVSWKEGLIRYRKKLQPGNGKLFISLDSLSGTAAQLEIRLFGKKLLNSHRSLFVKKINKPVGNKMPVVYEGPKSVTDQGWLPRMYMCDGGNGVIAVMGIRAEDPFLGIYNLEAKWIDLTAEKIYYSGLSAVGGRLWTCFGTQCILPNGTFESEDFFANIPNQIGTRPYNHVEGLFMFGDGDFRHGWSVLDFTFEL